MRNTTMGGSTGSVAGRGWVGVVALALCVWLAACCGGCRAAGSSEQRFMWVEARPVTAASEEPTQVLVETSVITVRGPVNPRVFARATPIEGLGVAAWRMTAQPKPAAFGPQAQVLNALAVLALDGEAATIQIGEASSGREPLHAGMALEVSPTMGAGGLLLGLRHAQFEGGKRTWRLAPVTLAAPAEGGVLVQVRRER